MRIFNLKIDIFSLKIDFSLWCFRFFPPALQVFFPTIKHFSGEKDWKADDELLEKLTENRLISRIETT